MIQPLWRTVWRFIKKNKRKKLKIELPYDPAIPLWGKYLEKTVIQKEMCIPICIVALYNNQDIEVT